MSQYIAEKRETIIRFSDTERDAYIWTGSKFIQELMKKMRIYPIEKNPEDHEILSYCVPRKWIRIQKPKAMDEEYQEQFNARMNMARNKFQPKPLRNDDEE